MIPCSMFPMGGSPERYPRDFILFDGNNGETMTTSIYPGVYYIRGQGGGAGGGRGSFTNGSGGGSGAGFEGYIRVNQLLKDVVLTAGIAGNGSQDGTATTIGSFIIMGGGFRGLDASGAAQTNGGILTLNLEDKIRILNYTVQRNGNKGLYASSGTPVSGGHSVLTNTGGGASNRAATAPGAGGGGGTGAQGGKVGFYGELLIKYVGLTERG